MLLKIPLFSFTIATLVAATLAIPSAHALSCLPVETYLNDVVGKEEVVIFKGTSVARTDEATYTREVVKVSGVKQGYVENTVIVYHEKHPDWNYLCNNGPEKTGSTGLYVATRDSFGMYNVTQRLADNDPLIKTLEAALEKADVTGERTDLTATDRRNQILTALSDIFASLKKLFAEYAYWQGQ